MTGGETRQTKEQDRNNMTAATMKEHSTTHPQPHEQLLVGWLVGGTKMGRGDEREGR